MRWRKKEGFMVMQEVLKLLDDFAMGAELSSLCDLLRKMKKLELDKRERERATESVVVISCCIAMHKGDSIVIN